MALGGKEQQLGRKLSAGVSEIGTPAPKESPPPKNLKSKRLWSDIGQGLLAAAPLIAMAVPGLGTAAVLGISAASQIGGGLAGKARQKMETKVTNQSARAAATAASAQTGTEHTEAREGS